MNGKSILMTLMLDSLADDLMLERKKNAENEFTWRDAKTLAFSTWKIKGNTTNKGEAMLERIGIGKEFTTGLDSLHNVIDFLVVGMNPLGIVFNLPLVVDYFWVNLQFTAGWIVLKQLARNGSEEVGKDFPVSRRCYINYHGKQIEFNVWNECLLFFVAKTFWFRTNRRTNQN